MGSLLASTLNTRALPIGNLRYIRSDYPGKLTDREVDINTIVPNEKNIKRVLEVLTHE